MRTADLLLQDFDIEISNTRRSLERMPEDKAGWTPHARSMPFAKLAMHCATMPLFGLYIMEDQGMDLAAPTRPKASLVFESRDAMLRALDENADQCRAALAGASDEHLAAEWPFTWGQMVISRASRSLSFRQMCFNHLIHHTAQLGVYLRLNDIAVPALYGPSADEQWAPK
jgi:uncharacterized damage-inducible protein DinB